MSANLNKTGLILMAFPLHVARFYGRTIIVLLIGKCVHKEVRQGIGGSYYFFVLLHVPTNSPFNSQVILISELCVSLVICGPFVRQDVGRVAQSV